jgi:hypothetical protein
LSLLSRVEARHQYFLQICRTLTTVVLLLLIVGMGLLFWVVYWAVAHPHIVFFRR